MGDFVTHYLPSKTETKMHYDSESQADVTCPDHEEGEFEEEIQGLHCHGSTPINSATSNHLLTGCLGLI